MLCQRLCQEKRGTLELLDCSTLDSAPHSAQDDALPSARSSEKVMELAEINRTSVADQVASILRQRILDGELPAGTALQKIPMAASLGLSRNTVRQPTRILSLERFLTHYSHRGVPV